MKLNVRIPLAFAALASLPLIALGWFAFDRGRLSLENHARQNLEATSHVKRGSLEDWVDHAVHDLSTLAASPRVRSTSEALLNGSLEAKAELVTELGAMVTAKHSPFTAVELVSIENGEVVATTTPFELGMFRHHETYFIQSMSGPAVHGVHYSMRNQGPALTATAPIEGHEGALIGLVAADLDLDHLSRILSRDDHLTETGETYLVDVNGFAVTGRRHLPDESFSGPIATEGVSTCLDNGASFSGIYPNYRGVSVVGYVTWIPALNVCMVSETDTAEALSDVHALRTAVTVAGAGTALVSILLGLAFATSLTGPLGRLRDGAARLSAGGTDVRLPESSRDEIGQLAVEFNRMADAVAERQAALESMNTELEAARRTAEVASKAKSDFISRMSHELRTPLNVVLGFGQVMQLDPLSPEHENAVRHILKAGQHLLDLIDEVLDVARIEAGRLRLAVEPMPLADVLTDSVDLVHQLAVARSVTIEMEQLSEPAPYVRADPQRIRQVMLNLLSNAIKYNREGGRVTVSCATSGDQKTRVSVIDTGYGIPADKLQRVFNPFDRLGAEADPATEGTGLGLVLARSLTEAMGGEMGVESVEGEGCTFWFELPTVAARVIQPAANDQSPVDSGDGSEKAACTVLYIEDNLANVELVEAVIARRPNTRLLVAMQGSIGLEMAREHLPDLVILDLYLPDMRGESVLAELRVNPETAHIPIVVASADIADGTVQRLLAAGASAFLAKPFDVRQMIVTIDGCAGPDGADSRTESASAGAEA